MPADACRENPVSSRIVRKFGAAGHGEIVRISKTPAPSFYFSAIHNARLGRILAEKWSVSAVKEN